MSDQSDTEQEADTETTEVTEEASETEEDVVLDLDSAEEYETRIDELRDQLEEQREEIDELQDLLLDLTTRVADGRGMGVCPECHGPVQKVRRWFRPNTIECRRCGEQFHEY